VRLAIIDCGTNTFHLLIADTKENGKYQKVFSTRIPVKLGEGAINKGFIAELPFQRGINALKIFSTHAKNHNVDKIMAFATSAVRDASNGKELVDVIKKETGVEIDIIDGNREAELIYLGNREAVEMNNSVSLIMDIGGGSTEFILADKEEIFWKQSFNLGAARLLQRFDPSNPVTGQEITEIKNYLKENLTPLFIASKKYIPSELIGSSGAFDSVVEMIHGELGGEVLTDSKTGYEINIPAYHKVSQIVKSSTLEQRKQVKGLTPMRFDMIVVSCILIDFVMEQFHLEKMRVSTYSLKEGALVDFITKQGGR
jgi:exopolyphosphatase/guanosine-5'-triphosphate,3'-diphosphate pyrophosphatase